MTPLPVPAPAPPADPALAAEPPAPAAPAAPGEDDPFRWMSWSAAIAMNA